MATVARLVGVYDADGGLRGELAYLVGKAQGRHCSLCDITHSPVRKRREWDTYVDSLPARFQVVHRNERDSVITEATTGREPCVVAQTEQGDVVMLLDDQALHEARDVEGLARALDAAMLREGLAWPA